MPTPIPSTVSVQAQDGVEVSPRCVPKKRLTHASRKLLYQHSYADLISVHGAGSGKRWPCGRSPSRAQINKNPTQEKGFLVGIATPTPYSFKMPVLGRDGLVVSPHSVPKATKRSRPRKSNWSGQQRRPHLRPRCRSWEKMVSSSLPVPC